MPGPPEIRPVRGRRELSKFIKLPFRLHKGTQWVPPLIYERRHFLNREKNPYFEHADAEYFLAWRDGRPVPRSSTSSASRPKRCPDDRPKQPGLRPNV